MSDIVNDDDLSALAAEYVIGTLDPDERTRANVLLEVDEGFGALVAAWERRLGELHLMVEPVEPNGRIFERIKNRLGIRAPSAPPPFTPPPFAAPAVEPVRAPPPPPSFERRFETRFEPRLESRPESRLESRLEPRSEARSEARSELPRAPQLLQAAAELELEPPPAPQPEPELQPVPQVLTAEQQLADILEQADRFSVPQMTDTTAEPVTAELEVDGVATPQAESLLADAADAIAAKPDEPAEADQVEEAAPQVAATKVELRLAAGARKDSMLTPTDLARMTFRVQERRLETWRAAMLFMTVVAIGLSSLIAAWRFVPERLPPRLTPNAILGLPDLGPSERIPAQHGTQFEE
jgi:hypothetical protein